MVIISFLSGIPSFDKTVSLHCYLGFLRGVNSCNEVSCVVAVDTVV